MPPYPTVLNTDPLRGNPLQTTPPHLNPSHLTTYHPTPRHASPLHVSSQNSTKVQRESSSAKYNLSVSRRALRTNTYARSLWNVDFKEKHGRLERTVEHERVECDVHEPQDPGDDEEPVGSLVDHH